MTGKETKNTRKKGTRAKPLKIAALVVSAIEDLRDSKGTTPKKITKYISYASSMSEKGVKRKVTAALKRGVEYGILRRYRGHYFLPASDEMERANRLAARFSRLRTPAPLSFARSKTNSARKTKSRKREGIGSRERKSRKDREARSTPSVSTVSSLAEEIAGDAAAE